MTADTAAKDEGRMMPSVAGSTDHPGSFHCDEHRRLFRALNIHFGAGAVIRAMSASSTEKTSASARPTYKETPSLASLDGSKVTSNRPRRELIELRYGSGTVTGTSMASTFTATDGDAYEQQMGHWSQGFAEPFLDFVGPIGAESVLDLGCGTSSLTLALARRSATSRVCGLDVSAACIDYARRRTSDPQIEFRVVDACALPFPQASFRF